jgi:hypothetical protein
MCIDKTVLLYVTLVLHKLIQKYKFAEENKVLCSSTFDVNSFTIIRYFEREDTYLIRL